LTWKAKEMTSLSRAFDNYELWEFTRSWIRKFEETDVENVAEKFIYLWVTVNAWAAKSVPDLSRNHEDSYLVHCMAKDQRLSQRFEQLCRLDKNFQKSVNEFIGLAPVFQALWLNNHEITPWQLPALRDEFIDMVFQREPFIISMRDGKEIRFPAFAPVCAHDHRQTDQPIPADWPHVLSMIYQVRCNLFHGGKNYKNEGDRLFIKLACEILWEVWQPELPDRILRARLPWKRVLLRSGFRITDRNGQILLSEETISNRVYFQEILSRGQFGLLKDDVFLPVEGDVDERLWLRTVEACHGGAEGGNSDELRIMDTYMGGVVRWINQMGLSTTCSCDGHGQRRPRLDAQHVDDIPLIVWILNGPEPMFARSGRWIEMVGNRLAPASPRQLPERAYLLDLAEWLHDNQSQLTELLSSMRRIPSIRIRQRVRAAEDRIR